MIKECVVRLNNDDVTVVDFDGLEIQFPAIHKELKRVFVECENGKYKIVDKPIEQEPEIVEVKEETEELELPIQKNVGKKKTTNKTAKNFEIKEDNENA